MVSKNKIFLNAFTLAEVLIVLGIIGLIADMTIPTLIQRTQDKVAVTRLKKVYSVLSSAYSLAKQEHGTPENWDLIANNDPQGALNLVGKLSPFLKIVKNCGVEKGCFAEEYKLLGGRPYDYFKDATGLA